MTTTTHSKPELIELIRRYNTGANIDFLEQFQPTELDEYLTHLEAAERKVIRIGGWSKPRRKAS